LSFILFWLRRDVIAVRLEKCADDVECIEALRRELGCDPDKDCFEGLHADLEAPRYIRSRANCPSRPACIPARKTRLKGKE
jgi:hypothetical protein